MIQSGTLYTVNSTGNPTNMPIKGAWIRFTQSGIVKAQIQTNKSTGKYSVDVPIGKYVVELAVGSTTSYPRAAQEFELKTADKADAFQKWLYAKSGDVNDALLKSFKAVLDAANLAATNAKQSETNAKKAVDDFNKNTVGSGKVMKEGAGGLSIGTLGSSVIANEALNATTKSGFYRIDASVTSSEKPFNYGVLVSLPYSGQPDRLVQIAVDNIGSTLAFRGTQSSREWRYVRHDKNTTIDSNGFIKKASPIIKLFDDHIELNDSFKEAPAFEKIDTGIYKISNTLGLAKEGWFLEIPKNRNNEPYFRVDWFENDNKTIEIHVFERLNEVYQKDGKMLIREINGNPKNIGVDERWIDLRFHEEISEEMDI